MDAVWSKLPIDLQQEILSKDLKLLWIGRQLNKEIRTRLYPAYVEYLGNKRLTNKEIQKHRDKLRIIYFDWCAYVWDRNFYYIDDPQMHPNMAYSYVASQSNDETEYEIKINDGTLKNISDLALSDGNLPYLGMEEFDILIIWRAYMDRKECMANDPNYAKKQTIQAFNQIVSKRHNSKRISPLTTLFGYLLTHLWLFGCKPDVPKHFMIDVHPNNDEPSYEQSNVAQMKLAIDNYISVLNKWLENTRYDEKTSTFVCSKK